MPHNLLSSFRRTPESITTGYRIKFGMTNETRYNLLVQFLFRKATLVAFTKKILEFGVLTSNFRSFARRRYTSTKVNEYLLNAEP